MEKAKRGRGRPSLSGETGERFQVTIPPSVEAKIRMYGGGSLSAGIIKLAKRLSDSRPNQPVIPQPPLRMSDLTRRPQAVKKRR